MADAYATQLVAVDVDSGMIRVVPAPGKNVSDYLVTGLRKFVESTWESISCSRQKVESWREL